jgi:hypothetical protein
MNIRRITLAVGAATGGVLTAGFLQTAVAFAVPTEPFTAPGADSFTIGTNTFDPFLSGGTTPGAEGFNPLLFGTGSPTFFDTGAGDQDFQVFSTASTPVSLGTIDTTENVTQLFGITNTGFDVVSGTPVVTDPVTDLLPIDGTVYDVTNYGGGYINDYTDVPGATTLVAGVTTTAPDTVTDILNTPFGAINLSADFAAFDLASLDPGAAF